MAVSAAGAETRCGNGITSGREFVIRSPWMRKERCADDSAYFGRPAEAMSSVESGRSHTNGFENGRQTSLHHRREERLPKNGSRSFAYHQGWCEGVTRGVRTARIAIEMLYGRWTRRCLFATGRMCQFILLNAKKNCKTRQFQRFFKGVNNCWHASSWRFTRFGATQAGFAGSTREDVTSRTGSGKSGFGTSTRNWCDFRYLFVIQPRWGHQCRRRAKSYFELQWSCLSPTGSCWRQNYWRLFPRRFQDFLATIQNSSMRSRLA